MLEVVEDRKPEEGREWQMVGAARRKVVETLAAVMLEEAEVAAEGTKGEVHWKEVVLKIGRGWQVSGDRSRCRAELGVEKLEEEGMMMLVVVN